MPDKDDFAQPEMEDKNPRVFITHYFSFVEEELHIACSFDIDVQATREMPLNDNIVIASFCGGSETPFTEGHL